MQPSDFEETDKNGICDNCVGDPFLKELVKRDGDAGQCYYCRDTGQVISLEDMVEHIEIAFETHYQRTAYEPDPWQYTMHAEKDIDYEWEREGETTVDAIMYAAEISEEAANDIQQILAGKYDSWEDAKMGIESEFSSEAYYKEIMPMDNKWHVCWLRFEKTIKSEARFFSREAAEQLSELFDTIDEMRTQQEQPLIVDAGPETEHTHLYRARVFQSDDKLEPAMIRPDKELGTPPSHFASAGRMNARGISVFYGATSDSTALAEVRPPVGSKVLVAQFEIIRPIKLLDLSALGDVQETGSIFDPEYANRLGRMMFLRELSRSIVRPVMPDDQASEYLPTQAIADFLATEGKVPLDGILYKSVQGDANGLNAVLFHKAARCKELEFPEGTEFSARMDMPDIDDFEPKYLDMNYSVLEEVPPEREASEEENSFDFIDLPRWSDLSDDDERKDTLSVDLESVRVHLVNAVQIDSTPSEVGRFRSTKSDFKPRNIPPPF